tara:strand:- start:45 stop:521 length:477 start_codon:yes stop_codon:yes gene_type:complete
MNFILVEIGYFGPSILFLAIIYLTIRDYSRPHVARVNNIYAYIFLWQALNYALNEILKHLIQQPRPKDIAYINTWDSPPNIGPYGMPSGHAQQVVSEATYIALAFKNPLATLASTCIAMLTVYQRYIYQKHTFMQLVVGSIIGAITGSTFYIFLSHKM